MPAGNIDSRNGSASATPAPRSTVRRDKCFFVRYRMIRPPQARARLPRFGRCRQIRAPPPRLTVRHVPSTVARAATPGGVSMKACIARLAMLGLVSSLPLQAQPPPAPPQPPCAPSETAVCGQHGPEDLAALGAQWIVAGTFGAPGGFQLVRTSDRASHLAYPAAGATNRPDTKTYPALPGAAGRRRRAVHDARRLRRAGQRACLQGLHRRPRRARIDRSVPSRYCAGDARRHVARLRHRAGADRLELGARSARRWLHHDELASARRRARRDAAA